MKKYKVYGPVQDGMFTAWQVIGPRGGFIAEFFTRKAATEFVKKHSKPRKTIKIEFVETR